MRKGTNQNTLQPVKNQLSNSWTEEDHFPHEETNAGMLVDAMAFIHKHHDKKCTTFSDMSRIYIQKLMES